MSDFALFDTRQAESFAQQQEPRPGYDAPRFNKNDTLYQRLVTVDAEYDTEYGTDPSTCYLLGYETNMINNPAFYSGLKGFPVFTRAQSNAGHIGDVYSSFMLGGQSPILVQSKNFACINGKPRDADYTFVGLFPFDSPDTTRNPSATAISCDNQTWNTTGETVIQGEKLTVDFPNDQEFQSGSYMPNIPQRSTGVRTGLWRRHATVVAGFQKACETGDMTHVNHVFLTRFLTNSKWAELRKEYEEALQDRRLEEAIAAHARLVSVQTGGYALIEQLSPIQVMEPAPPLHNIRIHKL